MSSFYIPQQAQVDLGGGNWVTIRKRTWGDDQMAIEKNTAYDMATLKPAINIFGAEREQLLVSIVAWEGEGFEGREVSMENLMALPTAVIKLIKAAIDEINAVQDDAEKKASTESTT